MEITAYTFVNKDSVEDAHSTLDRDEAEEYAVQHNLKIIEANYGRIEFSVVVVADYTGTEKPPAAQSDVFPPDEG